MRLFDLSGRTAVVTGGATGIGTHMATALAEAGANIVVCARDGARCEQTASQIADLGVKSLGLSCNVADPDDVTGLIATVVERFGGIDILVNNAGATWGAPAEEQPLAGWRKVIDVNLTGTFLVTQAAGRVMLERGGGKIVNVASVAALRGAPPSIRQAAAYSASKGGVVALTRDLACQWGGRGVNVNAVAPGWFPTAMSSYTLDKAGEQILDGVPLRRYGGADDIKGAVLFLASAASDYVTGQVIVVDGGKSVW
nr:SDR family oxidoreductase [Frankia canadensis]